MQIVHSVDLHLFLMYSLKLIDLPYPVCGGVNGLRLGETTMFTGIVDHTGCIQSIETLANGLCFKITTKFTRLTLGESIAVDGVCLTVTDQHQGEFCCDVSPETLSLTTLGDYKIGDRVNLERALAVGDRMGGHYVTGHVDGKLRMINARRHAQYLEIGFSGFTQNQLAYLVPKGSVTINGVSLTINRVEKGALSVMLIPHTYDITNLCHLTQGAYVNVEYDYYAKTIAHQLKIAATVEEAFHV